MASVKVPATTKGSEATVDVAKDGTVTLDGRVIGRVSGDGEYTYSPTAAGFGGRIARYHTSVREWQAYLPGSESWKPDYKGGIFPSQYRKNTRKAALAFLVAAARGAGRSEAVYFYWR